MKLTPAQRFQIDKMLAALAAAETGPTENDLAHAPVLDYWCPLFSGRGTPILWGIVTGHPRLGDNDHITTSPLLALDFESSWARTVSRWYRLAEPFTSFEADLARSLEVKEVGLGFLQFNLPGFQPLTDRAGLTRLLTAYADRIRQADAEDREARQP